MENTTSVRELTIEEVDTVGGAIAPALFVAAVVISKVSWTNVAMYTGAMVGAAAYGMVQAAE